MWISSLGEPLWARSHAIGATPKAATLVARNLRRGIKWVWVIEAVVCWWGIGDWFVAFDKNAYLANWAAVW
jgi:hypothetical protein